jgi:hypothetical protein
MEDIVEQCISCQNSDGTFKLLYNSRKAALEAAFFRKLKSGIEIYVYECPKRTGWHISSKYNENILPKNNIYSVFIDGYNLSDDDIDVVINEIKKDGEIRDIKLYGKYNNNDKDKWLKKGITIINVEFSVDQLDSVFVTIIIDIIRISLLDNTINAISIVSMNNNFNIIAKKVKKDYGLYTLGFGTMEKETDKKCFNKYININDLNMDVITFSNNLMEYIEMIKYGLKYSMTTDDGWVKYNDFSSTLRKKYPKDADRILSKKTIYKLFKTYPNEFIIKTEKNNYLFRLKEHTLSYGKFKKCSNSFGIIDEDNLGEFYVPASTFLSGKLSPKLINKKVKFKIYKYPDSDRLHGRAGEVVLI